MNARQLAFLGIIGVVLVVVAAACVNPRKGYRPKQPIAFSHQLHAGVQQIPCQYCHVSPGEGPNSSVPGVNTCMNCHSQVALDKDEVKKIHKAWETGEPIKWVKVHDMPDYVKFIHQPHINFGLDCTECHGDVASMDVVATTNRFNMGWCIECHRQPEHETASTDCVTCHY